MRRVDAWLSRGRFWLYAGAHAGLPSRISTPVGGRLFFNPLTWQALSLWIGLAIVSATGKRTVVPQLLRLLFKLAGRCGCCSSRRGAYVPRGLGSFIEPQDGGNLAGDMACPLIYRDPN